ncbi:UNVERIFIED_CONTAM: hypothetical protein FKN15_030306 [Acipenser sinensis]
MKVKISENNADEVKRTVPVIGMPPVGLFQSWGAAKRNQHQSSFLYSGFCGKRECSACLSYVGSYVFISYKNYGNFLEDKYTLLPAVIILVVAVVMFIIGIIGCCATLRESRVGLGFFLVIILIIFAAEVAAFVLAIVYKGRIKSDVERSMNDVFQKYDGSNAESRAVDYLQQQVQCCGVNSYIDWNTTQWYNSTGNHSVPESCCKQGFTNCTGRMDQTENIYTLGCESKLARILQDVLSYAMLVILGFAILKVIFPLETYTAKDPDKRNLLKKISQDLLSINNLLNQFEAQVNQQKEILKSLKELEKLFEEDVKQAKHLKENIPPHMPRKGPVQSRYMKGRFTYDQINNVIQDINKAVVCKYKILKQSLKSMNNATRKLYQRFKDEECKETKGQYFIVDADIKEFTQMKVEKKFHVMLNMLRHCQRLREVRGGGIIRYMLQ